MSLEAHRALVHTDQGRKLEEPGVLTAQPSTVTQGTSLPETGALAENRLADCSFSCSSP